MCIFNQGETMVILKKIFNYFFGYINKCVVLRKKYKKSHISCKAHISNSATIEDNVTISDFCFINYNVLIQKFSHINMNTIIDSGTIGKFCSIGPYCHIGAGMHSIEHLTTSHVIQKKLNNKFFFESFPAPPIIGNDVWIGSHVCILQNVTIGDGSIIGAGSVVTKSIPPYSIAVGNPAKIIKCRFNEELMHKISALEWWNNIDNSEVQKLILNEQEFKKNLI